MRLFILDVETQGLDPKQHKILEFAAVVYHVETKKILASYQQVLHASSNPVAEINGLTEEVLAESALVHCNVGFAENLSADCDAFVAHHAPFDHGFLNARGSRLVLADKPWICSKADLKFSKNDQAKDKKLTSLAKAHGIATVDAHSALGDVLMVVALLQTLEPAELVQQVRGALVKLELENKKLEVR